MKRVVFFCVFVVVLGSMFCAACQQAVADTASYTASRDNWLFQLAPGGNYGAQDYMGVGGNYWGIGSGECRAIVGFNMADDVGLYSALVAGTAQINSVTLRLQTTAFDNASGTTPTTDVYAVSDANADWVEGTIIAPPDAAELGSSCWIVKAYDPDPEITVYWAGASGLYTAGTDYVNTLLATHTYAGVPGVGTDIDFAFTGTSAALTALLTHWATGTNGGLLLMDPTTPQGLVFYSTREGAAAPQLTVGYTVIPEPGTLTLLVCGLVGLLAYAWRKRR